MRGCARASGVSALREATSSAASQKQWGALFRFQAPLLPRDSAPSRTLFCSSISFDNATITDQDIRYLLGVFFDAVLGAKTTK